MALSFRLWGDPETRIFTPTPRPPKRAPVSAAFVAPDTLEVRTPAKRLPEARTKAYVARPFPGSQLAGIVKRLKDKEERKLMPLYFFRLALPEGFVERGWTRLAVPDNPEPRAVFLVNAPGRLLYVLYFPAEANPDETFTLRFSE